MLYHWSKTVFPIAILYSFRMLGLLMLIPVFTLYASNLKGATPTLIGFALGCYGFSQGMLQIPFGLLSDKFGRKPLLIIGFSLFALGSLLGALSTSIQGVIIARFLQGMGAVGSVLMALLADLTPAEVRTKAMAIIGASIGTSFSISMVVGPIIAEHFGLAGIFYFTVFLAIAAFFIILYIIPDTKKSAANFNIKYLKPMFLDKSLQKLYFGIFIQHFILTATFFIIPLQLKIFTAQNFLSASWQFYLPLMLVAFIIMIPCIIIAEKKAYTKTLYLASIIVAITSQLLLVLYYKSWDGLLFCTFLYFLSFNILEALLPSLASKIADPDYKGTVMGIYSSSQFLGIFAGGAIAGLIANNFNNANIFFLNAILAIIWLLFTKNLRI